MKKILLITIFILISFLCLTADDKELFLGEQSPDSGGVKPNIMILLDNSGSMNTAIYHPNYTSLQTFNVERIYQNNGYPIFNSRGTSFISRTHIFPIFVWTSSDGKKYIYYYENTNTINAINGNEITISTWLPTSGYLVQLEPTIATAKFQKKHNKTYILTEVQGTFTQGYTIYSKSDSNGAYTFKPRGVRLYGKNENNNYLVRYNPNYLRWLYAYSTDQELAEANHNAKYGTFDTTSNPGNPNFNVDYWKSACSTPGNNRIANRFTRMQVAREVVCQFADNALTKSRLGLFNFRTSTSGGEKKIDIKNLQEGSNLNEYKNITSSIKGDTWTPLGEALADVWKSFKPSNYYYPSSYEIKFGWGNHDANLKPSASLSPIQWECQQNYVILITDGSSTRDNITTDRRFRNSIFRSAPVKRKANWQDWSDGWGDEDENEAYRGIPSGYNQATATYCPRNSCWEYYSDGDDDNGSDYLDDIAYMMANSDLYPDESKVPGGYKYWPGKQIINTFVIGFNTNNHMLAEAAENGKGEYYTASNYDDLVKALDEILTNIKVREYAFAAITAPRKTGSAGSSTRSYVGFFIPSGKSAFWTGHLESYELIDLYGYDKDDSGVIEDDEYTFDDEYVCQTANNGKACTRMLKFSDTPIWDARTKMETNTNRNLHFNNTGSTVLKPFTIANQQDIKNLITNVDDAETSKIIDEIRQPRLADIYHSDVLFVGEPPKGKSMLPQYRLVDQDAQTFKEFYDNVKGRAPAIYTGSNGGILHMFDYDGNEKWGFIPDEVIPSFKQMVIGDNPKHTYTVDGRLTVEDIAFKSGSGTNWHTTVTFGLRDGGRAYYALDITEPGTKPKLLWKFKDENYSGNSWGKAAIGKVKIQKNGEIIDQYISIMNGGMKYNHENKDNSQGKSLFIVDAATGEPIWVLAYDKDNGAEDDTTTNIFETNDGTPDKGVLLLSKDESLNYSAPADPIAIDKDNDGYIDYIYFGNLGGNLFKCDITAVNVENWKPYLLFKNSVETLCTTNITQKESETSIKVASTSALKKGYTIMGTQSKAMAYIIKIKEENRLIIKMLEGSFNAQEPIVCKNFNPIFLQPTVAYDQCSRLWVFWGTGDRDRPHSNPNKGKFYALRDAGQYYNQESDLKQLAWTLNTTTGQYKLTKVSTAESGKYGWFFEFPILGEKLFDPVPVVVSNSLGTPVILFNSYNPKLEENSSTNQNPCQISEGGMKIYKIKLLSCTGDEEVEGESESGRLAGGGMHGNKEYVPYKDGTGQAGGNEGTKPDESYRSRYNGGIIYWQERKR